jgi:acyl phosphate:glycerol-3-phosphate acyltransferase
MSGLVAAGLAGFALGSIPFSWILARLVGGVDIRTTGSGNVGATNVARTLGWAAGATALLLDAAKGAAAVLVAPWIAGFAAPDADLVAGGLAVLGHMFSPFLLFRGGKGVATGLGAFAVLAPGPLAAAVAVFVVVVLVTRMVSAGSIAAVVALPIAALGFGAGARVALVAALVGALVIVRHRDNIGRILAGTERRIGGRGDRAAGAGGGGR